MPYPPHKLLMDRSIAVVEFLLEERTQTRAETFKLALSRADLLPRLEQHHPTPTHTLLGEELHPEARQYVMLLELWARVLQRLRWQRTEEGQRSFALEIVECLPDPLRRHLHLDLERAQEAAAPIFMGPSTLKYPVRSISHITFFGNSQLLLQAMPFSSCKSDFQPDKPTKSINCYIYCHVTTHFSLFRVITSRHSL